MKTRNILKSTAVSILLSYSISSISVAHTPTPNNVKTAIEMKKQMTCLAQVIYDEARGESKQGKIAVGNVVMNRTKTWDKNVCEVVYHKRGKVCQFSGMCSKGTKEYDVESLNVAYRVFTGQYRDLTKGATYFHATYVKPKWMKVYTKTVVIGNHHFYSSNQTL